MGSMVAGWRLIALANEWQATSNSDKARNRNLAGQFQGGNMKSYYRRWPRLEGISRNWWTRRDNFPSGNMNQESSLFLLSCFCAIFIVSMHTGNLSMSSFLRDNAPSAPFVNVSSTTALITEAQSTDPYDLHKTFKKYFYFRDRGMHPTQIAKQHFKVILIFRPYIS